jgi:hypothetical protein
VFLGPMSGSAARSRQLAAVWDDKQVTGVAGERAACYAGAATLGFAMLRPAVLFTLSGWLFLGAGTRRSQRARSRRDPRRVTHKARDDGTDRRRTGCTSSRPRKASGDVYMMVDGGALWAGRSARDACLRTLRSRVRLQTGEGRGGRTQH